MDLDFDLGTPGASARREHERRRARRYADARAKHPRLSGILLALRDDPAHEVAWARGASGEEFVAASLAKRLNHGAVVLHDRRIPGSRANIDHIVVARSGVWVIDSKRYKGKVSVESPLFGSPRLMIGGRNQTPLADGLTRQVALIAAALGEIGTVLPVRGAMCFVGSELPLLKPAIQGHLLLHPRGLARRVNQDGPLPAAELAYVARDLAARFPVA